MMKGSTPIDSAVRTEDGIIDNIHEKHLRRVGNPRLYHHPYQSAQLELWPTGSVEWYLILRAEAYGPRPRRKRGRLVFLQIPLFLENEGTHG